MYPAPQVTVDFTQLPLNIDGIVSLLQFCIKYCFLPGTVTNMEVVLVNEVGIELQKGLKKNQIHPVKIGPQQVELTYQVHQLNFITRLLSLSKTCS